MMIEKDKSLKFERVPLSANDVLRVTVGPKPIAVWVPSNYTIDITAPRDVTLDISEVVDHHDIVSLSQAREQAHREVRAARAREKRARRRLRRLERTGMA